MSRIITFYSYKGGVGRTMALANIGCALASRKRKVLIVDWDLDAPGLHRYFTGYDKRAPAVDGGTIGMLEAMARDGPADSASFETTLNIPKTQFFPGCQLQLLQAGLETANYEHRVLNFNLKNFYRKGGAAKLELLREIWHGHFDFVLIDSRTGITDIGGICTIFLPDILALVFTPNEQSLTGVINAARRAQKGRQTLSFDRSGLTIFPIPSRLDFRTEEEQADAWMNRFVDDLSPFLSAWFPRDLSSRILLERIKIPHVATFSFGEKLPTVTHGSTNPDLPGFNYENIVRILEGEFTENAILSACGIAREFKSEVSRIATYAPAELIGRQPEFLLLNEVWAKVRRGEPSRPGVLTVVGLGGEGKTSLVAKWAAELAHEEWPGCDAAFAWSFYSQGTHGQLTASSDMFLKEALLFFGDDTDKQFAESNASAFEKGQRLARIVGKQRNLLILDGVEPLQYAPTSPTAGELKDTGLAALLKGLAAANRGLCLVTTSYSIPDLRTWWDTTAPEVKLKQLSVEAGVHLLRKLGVRGTTREFETLVKDVKGHALTLNLLGTYLRDAHAGDIRKRDLVKLEEADIEAQRGHAFRLMSGYVGWLASEGHKGKSALAILSLLGLFDRPATVGLVAALLAPPSIPNLTEPLVETSDAQRNLVLKRLEEAKLLIVTRDTTGALVSLDAHPLVREYFSRQLRTEQPETWRAAHRRLYEHLCMSTPDKAEPVLEDLQPLYQAVAHGCQAGLHQEVCDEVYIGRINRRRQFYSTKKLGAFASSLGAVACFFETPWSRVSPQLAAPTQAWLLAVAAFNLRALGRLAEALEPMRVGLTMYVNQESWRAGAMGASNLSELELTLGKLTEAVRDAEQSVSYADRSGDSFAKIMTRAICADVLHQAGRGTEAELRFNAAEQMQRERQPKFPLLYSLSGFLYCDLLMSATQRLAWQRTLASGDSDRYLSGDPSIANLNDAFAGSQERVDKVLASKVLDAVLRRSAYGLQWVEKGGEGSLLDSALDHLTLGRASLYEQLLSQTSLLPNGENFKLRTALDNAVNDLRHAGQQQYLPLGLLTRAWVRSVIGSHVGPESAQEDLDEAWEIAERGPMRLHMADIHLYRARLFFRAEKYPWESPQKDLEEAERLINQCGYHRRDEELADAKRVILGQSV